MCFFCKFVGRLVKVHGPVDFQNSFNIFSIFFYSQNKWSNYYFSEIIWSICQDFQNSFNFFSIFFYSQNKWSNYYFSEIIWSICQDFKNSFNFFSIFFYSQNIKCLKISLKYTGPSARTNKILSIILAFFIFSQNKRIIKFLWNILVHLPGFPKFFQLFMTFFFMIKNIQI